MTTYKCGRDWRLGTASLPGGKDAQRSEEHTSELQSQSNLVCRLLLEKKKKLPSQRVIHTVYPVYSRRQDRPAQMSSCYLRSRAVAPILADLTVAFPSSASRVNRVDMS